jgi:hypothetical protein
LLISLLSQKNFVEKRILTYHKRASGPSDLAIPMDAFDISATDTHPVSIIQCRNSS